MADEDQQDLPGQACWLARKLISPGGLLNTLRDDEYHHLVPDVCARCSDVAQSGGIITTIGNELVMSTL